MQLVPQGRGERRRARAEQPRVDVPARPGRADRLRPGRPLVREYPCCAAVLVVVGGVGLKAESSRPTVALRTLCCSGTTVRHVAFVAHTVLQRYRCATRCIRCAHCVAAVRATRCIRCAHCVAAVRATQRNAKLSRALRLALARPLPVPRGLWGMRRVGHTNVTRIRIRSDLLRREWAGRDSDEMGFRWDRAQVPSSVGAREHARAGALASRKSSTVRALVACVFSHFGVGGMGTLSAHTGPLPSVACVFSNFGVGGISRH